MLLTKCIDIINKEKIKIKILYIPSKYDTNNIEIINKLLQKYYNKHTRLTTYQQQKNIHQNVDKLPIIKYNENVTYIKFFDINGSFIDYLKNPQTYKSYKTNSRYGKQLQHIVNITKNALNKNDDIFLDFTNCGGGDIDVFIDAFSPLLSIGLQFYFNKPNPIYVYYNGYKLIKKKQYISKFIPPKNHNITIKFNKHTSSSAEFIIMMILNSNKNVKLIGKNTAGMMSIVKSKIFYYNNSLYELGYPITDYLYDSHNKQYNGIIKN